MQQLLESCYGQHARVEMTAYGQSSLNYLPCNSAELTRPLDQPYTDELTSRQKKPQDPAATGVTNGGPTRSA